MTDHLPSQAAPGVHTTTEHTTTTSRNSRNSGGSHLVDSRAENEAVACQINALLLKCHARLAVNGLPYIDPAERVPEDLPTPSPPRNGGPDAHLEAAYLWAVLDAEDAAEMASRWRLSQQRARARLYLGHCFRALEQWKEALQCYVDAASVWGIYWGQADIQGLTRLCHLHLTAHAHRQKSRRRTIQSWGFDLPGKLTPLQTDLPPETHLPLNNTEWLPDAEDSLEAHISRATTPSEPLALIDGEGYFVSFMFEMPDLRRIRGSPDLRGEDWRKMKQEEERHPFAVRTPRVAYRKTLAPGQRV